MSRAVVIADTDIIVHLMTGDILEIIIPDVIDEIYITPKVAVELQRKNLYQRFINLPGIKEHIKITKEIWGSLSVEARRVISDTRARMSPIMDPGECDCYSYAVGMGIDAIISDDSDARTKILDDSEGAKVVLNFAQILLLGAQLGKFTREQAHIYYDEVIQRNHLTRFASFGKQVDLFERATSRHRWVQTLCEQQ